MSNSAVISLASKSIGGQRLWLDDNIGEMNTYSHRYFQS